MKPGKLPYTCYTSWWPNSQLLHLDAYLAIGLCDAEKAGLCLGALLGGVFWVLSHVMGVGKSGGRSFRGGYNQISVNNARNRARALELAVERTGMYFRAG
jgi:hypothetical protein